MRSINVGVYGEYNKETHIPLRFCLACHDRMKAQIARMRWDKVLKTEAEIMADKELAAMAKLEHDPSILERQMREAEECVATDELVPLSDDGDGGREDYGVNPAFPADDESEAAMRRRGKRVDVTY